MKYLYPVLAITGLLLTLIPSILLYLGMLSLENMKMYMFIGAVVWFSGAIPWLGKKKNSF